MYSKAGLGAVVIGSHLVWPPERGGPAWAVSLLRGRLSRLGAVGAEGSPIAIGIRICSTTASSGSTAKKGGSALITVVPLRLEDSRANP
jgi:hypothetical protein